MKRLNQLILKIKRRETPAADLVYRAAKKARSLELPAPKAVYLPLYHAHVAARQLADDVARVTYYQPMFRARADVGKSLYLYGGIPYIYGHLRIEMGDHCKLSAKTSLVSGKVLDDPVLRIGDHSSIGYGVTISVSERVELGKWVRVADGVVISDNPGHPLDPIARRTEPPTRDQIRPVVIEDDVWIGGGARIMPGVRIGRGSVIGAGSVVTRDVPSMSVAVGSPAKVVKTLANQNEREEYLEEVA